jgi:hypothetical protein
MKQLYSELEQGSDITLVSRLPAEAKPMIQQLSQVAGPKVLLLEKIKLFGVTLVTSSAKLAGGITLLTGSPDEANAFVDLGKNAIGRLLTIPGIGMTPAYGVLKTVQTEVRGDRATFSGLIKVTAVETLLELAPALDALAGDMMPGAKPEAPKPPTTAAPAPVVEQLKPAEEPKKKKRAE